MKNKLFGLSSLLLCCGACSPDKTLSGAGAQAAAYLLHEPYRNLTIEVDLMGNVAAEPVVRDIGLGQVRKTLEKPGKVKAIVQRPDREYVEPSGGYTLADLRAIEQQHREIYNEGETASLYVLYLPGHWHEDSFEGVVLGAAYDETSLAVFPDTVRSVCSSGKLVIDDPEAKALLCPLTEAAVWVHEFGHLIGLVDNGVPTTTNHLDAEHGNHDINDQCIMHWSHESGKLAKFIENRLKAGNTQLDVFDQACKDDLAAFRSNAKNSP